MEPNIKRPMTFEDDPEIRAMSRAYEAVHELTRPEQKRVLDWLVARLEAEERQDHEFHNAIA